MLILIKNRKVCDNNKMASIKMLGTGHGFVFDIYNTCFLLKNNNEKLLVDTGGGAEIVRRLKQSNIDLKDIHNIFISHCHTDHILGLMWMLKRMSKLFGKDTYKGKLNIYCNSEVAEAIPAIYSHLFPTSRVEAITEGIDIHILSDGDKFKTAGLEFTAIDTKAKKNSLLGFDVKLNNKRLCFLGDEECNPEIYPKIENADYVMHEAFCLDSEEKIFKPYQHKHSTVKSVCEKMNKLNIKNLILYHTEETHMDNRKELYINEGKQYFSNNIIVPDEMEEIEIR